MFSHKLAPCNLRAGLIYPHLWPTPSTQVTITKNKSAKFGADLLRIDKEYYVIRVYEVDISRGVTSEKTGAYRMGLSFGDRIVSINRHAASQIDDVRHVLDDATTVTVEFVGQPLFMKVMLHVSDGQLEGLKLKGRKVEEIMSTSAAYHRGVRTGHVVFAVEEVSCLGDSDDVVEQLVNSYLPKHRYLNFMFVGETVWYLFLEGVEAMIARSGKSVSVRQYVGHSLMLDKERMEGYKSEWPERHQTSEMRTKREDKLLCKHASFHKRTEEMKVRYYMSKALGVSGSGGSLATGDYTIQYTPVYSCMCTNT
ncbi:hypothetical protein SARC_09354 [Sphaeroforma arctica JP610]|uniref:PDZ domain-containing protein n=1 Tax=Sphaeroforma arctica JP610 TaxID=667725 RepID=A0A0L0FP02_9EUKA|nr:hypothetical protein SARC_09354 [Sphaeroforma arctica JP610]KNC78201.1 hypothetical protein SARC_09354 [Sphaeroforma arctica JP610]|eukprot:XP_014152103.1 hypothetical protein SARC_09354 [Sphaeroforma arctica JP610]